MEYSTVNFKAQKDAIYNDSLPAGTTTRASHRQANENVADSAVMLDDLAPVTASGTDTYTATLLKDPGAAYANTNRFYLVKFTNANTGAATINFNSRGAKDLKKAGSSALVSGDIVAGSIHLLGWDGTNFQVLTSLGSTIVSSGTYTPTLTNVSNVSSSTAHTCQYMRVGSVVTVSGKVEVDITTTLASTVLQMTLPVASSFTVGEDCGGVGTTSADQTTTVAIFSDSVGKAQFAWSDQVATGNRTYYFTFTYLIK